jgi:ComF family protein
VLAAANAFVRVMLAPPCVACGETLTRPLTGPVCERCWLDVRRLAPPLCVQCGDDLAPARAAGPRCARCSERDSPMQLARSAAHYEGSLREIVHAFKYDRRRPLARPLAALMRDAGRDVLAGADAVVPVPLHPWRLLQRGFNQAEDLSREMGLPVWHALRRRRDGPPQATLAAAARRANVRDAFAPGRLLHLRHPRLARRNGTVVLIDDVMTTGETLDACARVLLDAGVRNVRALTAARARAAPRLRSWSRPGPSAVARRSTPSPVDEPAGDSFPAPG